MVKAGRSSRGAHTEGRGARGPKPKQKEEKEMLAGARTERSAKGAPRIDPKIQREIGKHLRAHYDDVINEPVPDKFIELLEQLERSVSRKE